jgi:hypothetical protein
MTGGRIGTKETRIIQESVSIDWHKVTLRLFIQPDGSRQIWVSADDGWHCVYGTPLYLQDVEEVQ